MSGVHSGAIMAAISGAALIAEVRDYLGGNHTNSLSTHTVTLPASVNAGDLLIITFWQVNTDALVAGPAGWTTEIDQTPTGGFACRFCVFSKIADGTEGGTNVTVQFAAARGAAWCSYSIFNYNTTNLNPIENIHWMYHATSPRAPNGTASQNNCIRLAAVIASSTAGGYLTPALTNVDVVSFTGNAATNRRSAYGYNLSVGTYKQAAIQLNASNSVGYGYSVVITGR